MSLSAVLLCASLASCITIYLKMLNEKLWPIVSKRDDCANLYFQQDGDPLIMLYRFESGLMNIFQTDG